MAELIALDERDAPFAFMGGILDEAPSDTGVLLRIGGRMQMSDTPNANRRRYSRSLWETVLRRAPIVEALSRRQMYGEVDHPTDRRETSLKEASHVVTKLRLEASGEVYGEMDILDTPMGRIAEALFRARCNPGVSSRAEGSVKAADDGVSDVIAETYRFKTIDIVATPSTPGAYPNVLTEDVSAHEQRLCAALLPLVGSLPESAAIKAHSILNECVDPSIRTQANEALSRRSHQQPDQGGGSDMPDQRPTGAPTPLTEAAIQGLLDEKEQAWAAERQTLQGQLLAEQKARQTAEQRVQAAHDLLEASTARVTILEADQGGGYSVKEMGDKWCVYDAEGKKVKDFDSEDEAKEHVDGIKEGLQAKLSAAEAIIEELLGERDAAHKLIETSVDMLRGKTNELTASKKLLEGFLIRQRQADRTAAIQECIGKLGAHPKSAAVRTLLEGQQTADSVRAVYAGLGDILEGLDEDGNREPLPGGNLNENQSAPTQSRRAHSFDAAIVAHVSAS